VHCALALTLQNIDELKMICFYTPKCTGFNSDGWLKTGVVVSGHFPSIYALFCTSAGKKKSLLLALTKYMLLLCFNCISIVHLAQVPPSSMHDHTRSTNQTIPFQHAAPSPRNLLRSHSAACTTAPSLQGAPNRVKQPACDLYVLTPGKPAGPYHYLAIPKSDADLEDLRPSHSKSIAGKCHRETDQPRTF
jgi:hypothetical protein